MAEGLGGKGEGGPVRWERLPQVPEAERRRQAGGELLGENQRNKWGHEGRIAPMAGEDVRPWQRGGEGEIRQWRREEEGEMRQWRRGEEGGVRQQQRGEEGGLVWWEEDAEGGAERGMHPRGRGERGRGEGGTARGRGEGGDFNNSLDTRTTRGGSGVSGGRMNERGGMEELAEEWGEEGEEGGEGWVWWEEGGLYGRGRGGGEKGGGGGREGEGRDGGERREGGRGGDGMGAGREGGRGGGEGGGGGRASYEARQAMQAQPPAAFSTAGEEAGRGRGEGRERSWGVGGGARGGGGGGGRGGGSGRGRGQRGAYQGSTRGGGRGAPLVLPAVPEEVIGRHVKLKHVEDLWNEDDGPLERESGPAYNEYGTPPVAISRSMGFKHCTPLQAAVMPHILAGADLLVKASSGTGKTMAYMIPCLDRLLSDFTNSPTRLLAGAGTPVEVLLVCANRERAEGALQQAQLLLQLLQTPQLQQTAQGSLQGQEGDRGVGTMGRGAGGGRRGRGRSRRVERGQGKRVGVGSVGQQGVGWQGVGVQMVVGGMSVDGEGRRLQQAPCQVLVATPARLLEHLQQTQGMRNRVQQLKVLVIEDLDRMVDMGFTRTIHTIVPLLPPTRQTLLFSNALSKEMMDISQHMLKADNVCVDQESD
ncbi:unnamed protein product [Closterium sp. Yama58-4]|nr:unnamed protein product [Closterium sp. Yama58-4]